MMENLGDIGIGVVAAVLILREVFSFLKSQKLTAIAGDDPHDRIEADLATLVASTGQMAAMMLKTDDGGTPLVYTPRSLTTAIDQLAKNIDRLTDKVERVV
jgi:hypothetical protein